MTMLPPVGWADVATKGDLVLVRADIDQTRADVDRVRADLGADISRLRADVGADIERLRADLETGLTVLEHRLMTQFHKEMTRQIWSMFGFLTAAAAILTANNIF